MDKLIRQMRDICQSIAKGRYDFIEQLEELTIVGRHPKEITDLAESFSMMLLKLQAHEYELENALLKLKDKNSNLKEKVHTLKIDIDQMKRAKAVAEITQSSFFKEIQQKAKKRRKK